MARAVILYATSEGQTARIAERLARTLRDRGHAVEVRQADAQATTLSAALSGSDGVIAGASIHYGHHPASFRRLVRRHRDVLAARPNAFFSVSLSAGGPGAKPATARRYMSDFLRQVGWQPAMAATFAGALPYSKLGAFKRRLVLVFVRLAGGDTDTSRDYEYTDWSAVDRFAADFARLLPNADAPSSA
jgi:menaquinone-dependent protoporphyrinogen oxidase